MPDAHIPASIGNSPLGERLHWILRHVCDGGDGPFDEEIERLFVLEELGIARRKELLRLARAALAGAELREVRTPDPAVVLAVLARDALTWDLGLRIEAGPPHRIRNLSLAERAPGVKIRVATEADGAALREIELKTPIVLGDTKIVYDRGKDYFAGERLMGNSLTHIAELHGRPVGLTAWVAHEICANGVHALAGYKHRTRLLPEARGQGIREMLDFAGFAAESWQRGAFQTFTAAANETVRHIYKGGWSVYPERLVIDTARSARPDAGRRCTAADGERIVDLLNLAHGREELYARYTEESLAARLTREPALYSWPQFRLGEHAVIGVWPENLVVIRTVGDVTTRDTRALVLDYGYEEGAEDEFLSLVGAECGSLARSGITELTIFIATASSAYQQLASLAKRTEPQVLYLSTQEPADVAARGIYVDQLYF